MLHLIYEKDFDKKMIQIEDAISYRNKIWENNIDIPKWVNIEDVNLDQFFTKLDIAQYCYQKAINYLKSKNVNIEDCLFVEPSAGDGIFFNLLPINQRIGIDVCPMCNDIQQGDFLSFDIPQKKDKTIIVIGNPPFGYRAWLALQFMQRASIFADYVFFILPMGFQSEGKGSPRSRIKGLKLIHTEILPKNSFRSPDGKDYNINALFQIWEKGTNDLEVFSSGNLENIDIFTVDKRKERLCGHEKMKKANFFLQRTYFSEPPSLVKSFDEVRYGCGYGLIVKNQAEKVRQILLDVNWNEYSNLAAHGCRHISMYHIKKALLEHGAA